MSTRSTIVLQIPTDRNGKTYKYKGGGEHATPDTTIPSDAKYVEVYCHFDGYVEGVGKKLKDDYSKGFDDAMERLVCGGDMSSPGNPYHAVRGDEWERCCPMFYGSLPECSEEYEYIMGLDGVWRVSELEEMFKNDRGEWKRIATKPSEF